MISNPATVSVIPLPPANTGHAVHPWLPFDAGYVVAPWYQVVREILVILALVSVIVYLWVRIDRTVRNRRWRAAADQPLHTLELQSRLGALAAEVQRLEVGDEWARGHHLKAAEIAYDQVLAEAWRRAGLADADDANQPVAKTPNRFDMELALSEHGWNW